MSRRPIGLPPRPPLVALQFLTRLPLRLSAPPSPAALAASLPWYPVVGLLLGGMLSGLALFARAYSGLPDEVLAALLLAAWVLITGALHLDGLADCADAWMAGGDAERRLRVMRDVHAGTGAVVALVLLLLSQYVLLLALLRADAAALLWLAPLLARAVLPPLLVATRYVRPGGLGEALAGSARFPAVASMAVAAVPALWCGWPGVAALLAALGVALWLRAAALRALGGLTGDVAGATVCLVEVAVLLAVLLALPQV